MNNLGRAISPNEAKGFKKDVIPQVVFDTVNELLVRELYNKRATIKQPELVALLVSKGLSRDEIFKNHWLDFEVVYGTQGWKVVHDKPGYNESGEAYWVFTEKFAIFQYNLT